MGDDFRAVYQVPTGERVSHKTVKTVKIVISHSGILVPARTESRHFPHLFYSVSIRNRRGKPGESVSTETG